MRWPGPLASRISEPSHDRPPGRRADPGRGRRPRGGHHAGTRPPGDGPEPLRAHPGRAVHGVPGARRGSVGPGRRQRGASSDDPAGRGEGSARGAMNRGWRIGLFLGAAVGLAVLLVWGFAGIPAFGHYRGPYGDLLNAVGVRERHATDVVAAVVLDYRGFDTLGEEFILFASVVGVALLLRAGREEEQIDPSQLARARERPPTTDAVRTLGLALVGPTVLLGLYVVAHGHLTPGGGFQGGAVLASASILVFLCGKYLTFRRLNPV